MPTGVKTSFENRNELQLALRQTFLPSQVTEALAAVIAPNRQDVLNAKYSALLKRAAELGIDPSTLKEDAADVDDIPF